ncbi:MAG: hypothetical protein M0Q87_15115 [Ottowia sp.]|nr:hypothetical protein [Ottowia sp.]
MIEEVLVIFASDSLQTQGMAMALASTMARQGAKVNVLLCDQAGDLALKNDKAPALKPKDPTPGQMLRQLLEQGALPGFARFICPAVRMARMT